MVEAQDRDGLSQLQFAEERHKDILGHLMVTVPKIVKQEGIDSYRLVVNDGASAGQTVLCSQASSPASHESSCTHSHQRSAPPRTAQRRLTTRRVLRTAHRAPYHLPHRTAHRAPHTAHRTPCHLAHSTP